MAVTVNLTPDSYTPVYNPVLFSVSSTNYAQSNFEFVCDIYINSAVTMTQRLKFPAYPGQNYAYVDIGGVLKQYLTSDVYGTSDAMAFTKNGNSILRYDIQWGESYGASSGVTVYPNLTSSNGYGFNGSFEFINLGLQYTVTDFPSWISASYRAPSTIKFMTNLPTDPTTGQRQVKVSSSDSYCLYFFNTSTNYAKDCQVSFYTSAGVFISASTVVNAYNSVSTYDTRFLRVPCGPSNLASAGISIPATASYYLFGLRDNSGIVSSEIVRFTIDNTCSKAPFNYRFIFLNRQGAFDAFTFYGQYERTVDTKKDYYKNIGGTWTGNQFFYWFTNRAQRQYNTIGQDSFKCWSGWITQDQSDWLADLMDSPEVYVIYPSTPYVVPVNITNTSYQYKTTSKDQLFNLELTFQPTFTKVRQQF